MDTPVWVALIASASSLVAALLVYRSSKRANAIALEQANLGWAREVRQDAADARNEVAALREEVRTLRRQLEVATREADHWITEHQGLRRHAWRPGMTIDRLRDLIGPVEPPATANGH